MPKSKTRHKKNRPATGGIPPIRQRMTLDPIPEDRAPTAEDMAKSLLGELFTLAVAGTQRYDSIVARHLTAHKNNEVRDWLEVACLAISKAYDIVEGGNYLEEELTKNVV
ncbi:hypothetical protein PBI_CANTARE_54 [Brevibacterium phage Cantare]|uniref:Uncharacterized protein n=1 Tax=Brevibacterium phage Cantare TaxID=2338395 RepID=A0A3G3LYQ6_9CAUD|nr:hypothetical protein PQD70_gp054 [Brevibacterium phage Cantare]AYQ99274.1 hypothetical protein PBI_CANTARE_54 [Brevibacterium phage Cantare]